MENKKIYNFAYSDKNSPFGFRIRKPFRIIGHIVENAIISLIFLAVLLVLENTALSDLLYSDEKYLFAVIPSLCIFIILNFISLKVKECAVLDDKELIVYYKSIDISDHFYIKRLPYNEITDIYTDDERETPYRAIDIMGGAYDKYHIFVKSKRRMVVLPIKETDEFVSLLKHKAESSKN